jgi:hypothetical protein
MLMITNELVDCVVKAIDKGQDYTLCVQEPERDTLKSFVKATDGRDLMLLGIKGLPTRTAKLVKLGVCYIDGDYVCLHRDIYVAIQKKERKFEDFLEKLKRKHRNNVTSHTTGS